jgi:hypothetical protein
MNLPKPFPVIVTSIPIGPESGKIVVSAKTGLGRKNGSNKKYLKCLKSSSSLQMGDGGPGMALRAEKNGPGGASETITSAISGCQQGCLHHPWVLSLTIPTGLSNAVLIANAFNIPHFRHS